MGSNNRAGGGGGDALVFEVGYHPRRKIHIIRVFQDQAMYVLVKTLDFTLGQEGGNHNPMAPADPRVKSSIQ